MSRYFFGTLLFIAGLLAVAVACNAGDDIGLNDDEVQCIADSECEGDAYCVDDFCVECGVNSHCPDGVCYRELNECVPCEESSDCAGSDVCVDFECLECGEDTDCPDGVCEQNQCVECASSADCGDDICHENECQECAENAHCSGDDICNNFSCVSGCEDFDCGAGGQCVDDNGSIACECDEGFVLGSDGTCDSCVCEVENGTGECQNGTCTIDSCDAGYSTEDNDPDTGCECGPDDTPDPENFVDSNCDGLDGNMSAAIFVSEFGDDEDDGRPLRPVRSIAKGIELAADDPQRDDVFIAEGIYEETIALTDSVNLYGGYRDEGDGTWNRGPDFETVLTGVDQPLGHRPLVVQYVTSDIDIQLMTIVADDAETSDFYTPEIGAGTESHAGTAVGMVLNDNTGHINISHVDIEVGSGADGSDGSDGDGGKSGSDGIDATDREGAAADSNADLECSYGDDIVAAGAPGGQGGNGRDGDDGTGESGTGTDGSTIDYPGLTPDTPGGAGGDYFDAGFCGEESQTGSDGEPGGAGLEAEQGEHAEAIDSEAELFVDANVALVYLGTPGRQADPGQPGGSGAGGGGGGGSYPGLCVAMVGGGGGSGGLGGCGGEGGYGGEPGGGSVGILAHSTEFSVSDGFIRTDVGGDGGDGGAGGGGGDGGGGGQGAAGEEHNPSQHGENGEDAGDGGSGGEGASGGQGGHGGGGEGGPSVGILHANSDATTTDLEFDLGRGGDGGAGGGDPEEGSTGPDGPDGIEAQIHEF